MTTPSPRRLSFPLIALTVSLVVVLIVGIVFWLQRQPPPLRVAEDTTVVTTPLDERGRVDYETALNGILKEGITPQTNAMVLYMQAIGPKPDRDGIHADWWAALGVPEPPEDGVYLFHNTYNYFQQETASDDEDVQSQRKDAISKEEDQLRQRPWKTADSPHFARWLHANEAPLKLIEDASRRTNYFNPVIVRKRSGDKGDLFGALMPQVAATRGAVNLLSIRVMWHLGEGRTEQAFADVLTIHRMSRQLIEQPGTMIEMLVGVAFHTIAIHSTSAILQYALPSQDMFTKWKAELLGSKVVFAWHRLLNNTERFAYLDSAFAMRDFVSKGDETSNKGIQFWLGEAASKRLRDKGSRSDWNIITNKINSEFDRLNLLVDEATTPALPRPQRNSARQLLADYSKELLPTSFESLEDEVSACLFQNLKQIMHKMVVTQYRTEQDVVFLDLAFDLEAYHRVHQRYPESLAELKRPTEALDGYSLKPLKYTRTETGYILHCFGPNKEEDWSADPTLDKSRVDDSYLHFHRGGPPPE